MEERMIPQILAYGSKLNQVRMNLIDNAIEEIGWKYILPIWGQGFQMRLDRAFLKRSSLPNPSASKRDWGWN
jgi:hypothetical protein